MARTRVTKAKETEPVEAVMVDTDEVVEEPEVVETEVIEETTDSNEEIVEEEEVDSGENPETAPPTVTFETEDKPDKQAVRNVKVMTKVDHTCTIGGVRYNFIKGKQVNVPENVKLILKQAGLLDTL